MFALLTLLCLFLLTSNVVSLINKPLGSWGTTQILIIITSLVVAAIAYFAFKQALEDYKNARERAEGIIKEKGEQQRKQRQAQFLDDFETQGDVNTVNEIYEDSAPQTDTDAAPQTNKDTAPQADTDTPPQADTDTPPQAGASIVRETDSANADE